MLGMVRVFDFKWRLDAFFVVDFLTDFTEIIVCTKIEADAYAATTINIEFLIVAPK